MPDSSAIYLDHAATTPVRPEVLEAMLPWLAEHHGNPTSLHRPGRVARRAIDHARELVAALIHADPREIIFTSGGTEANNLALRGISKSGDHLLTAAIEHHSVLHTAQALEKNAGVKLTIAPVVPDGRVTDFETHLTSDTALVSVMHANNETGVIQPIEAIGRACRDSGVLFHTDAIQSAGKLSIDVSEMPVDLLSLSAHKLNGPKGVGALYVRHGVSLSEQAIGGTQERGRRGGTENIAGIVGFGTACELAQQEMKADYEHLTQLYDSLQRGILERIPGTWLNGSPTHRLPHILNIGFANTEGEQIMMALDAEGIAVSTGSACTSGSVDPSHVLLAIGQSHAQAHGGVRFSLGRDNTQEEIKRAVEAVAGITTKNQSTNRR